MDINTKTSWNRHLWGIWFTSKETESGFLIGTAWANWCEDPRPRSPNEPSRALLFKTRTEARTWARTANMHWSYLKFWTVKAVKVREIVEIV